MFLVALVAWGTWQTLTGVNILLHDPAMPIRAVPAHQELGTRQIIEAIDSWTSAGSWEFIPPGAAQAAKHTDKTTLVPMPPDAQLIARRRGQDRQVLVEFYTTQADWSQLESHWRQMTWEVSPVALADGKEVQSSHLHRKSESVLVWSVSPTREAGLLRTIACSRIGRQIELKVSTQ